MRMLLHTEVLYVMLTNASAIEPDDRNKIETAADNGGVLVSVASLLQLREARREGLISVEDLSVIDDWMKRYSAQILPITVAVLASISRRWDEETVSDRLLLATARDANVQLATFRPFSYADVRYFVCRRTEVLARK